MSDRGVSEVLGYVLIISLVTVTIAIVMTTGIGGLEASQQAEQVNNMERGFDVLAHNVDQLVDGTAPSRATELRLADGSLGYGSASRINVTVGGQQVTDDPIVTDPIVYDSGTGTQILYETGAIIRSDSDGEVMLREPDFVITNETVMLGGVRTRPLAGSQTESTVPGTILLRGEYVGTSVDSATRQSDANVTLRVETEHVDAWYQYFERFDGDYTTINRSSEAASITLDPDYFDPNHDSVHIVTTRTRFTIID